MDVRIVIVLTVVALVYVWAPRAWLWWRWESSARKAVTYLLTPKGQRPVDLDAAGAALSSMLATVDAHQVWQLRRSGVSVHRFRTDAELRTAVTVYGHDEPDRIADRIADSIGATATHAPDLVLPAEGTWWHTARAGYKGRDPNDRTLPELGQTADWLAKTLGSFPDSRVCLTVTFEPTRGWEDDRLRSWFQHHSGGWDDTESAGPGQTVRAVIGCVSDSDTLAKTLTTGLPQQLHRWPFRDRGRMSSSLRSWASTGTALLFGPLVVVGIAVGRTLLGRLQASTGSDTTDTATVGPTEGATVGATPGLPAPPVGDVGVSPLTVDPAAGDAAVQTVDSIGSVALHALTAGVPGWFVGFAVVCFIAGAVAWQAPFFPNRAQHRWARLHASGVLPVQRAWRYSPALLLQTLRAERTTDAEDVNPARHGKQVSGPYPYRTSTATLNSHHIAQILAYPSIGQTSSTRTEVAAIEAPPDVAAIGRDSTLGDGSLLGHDPAGRPVRLLDTDRKSGIFVVGDPGSGKTVAVSQVFIDDARARMEGVRRKGQSTLLWIETKGDGANDVERQLAALGHVPLAHPAGYARLDVNAPVGPRLELLDRDDPAGSAARLVAAFTYAFETGSVGPRAAEAMRVAFELALRITPGIADAAGLGREPLNILWIATMLMERDKTSGSQRARLLEAIREAADLELAILRGDNHTSYDPATFVSNPDLIHSSDGTTSAPSTGSPLADALNRWNVYERTISPARWSDLFESPRNKLAAMAQVAPLWTPHADRLDVSLHSLLHDHRVAILNFGTSAHGRIDTLTSQRLAAITLFMLWEEIKRTCTGWLEDGRSVGVFSDELSHLSGTGSGDDVIGEMHDKGRSFGVQLCLATQRLAQLPKRTADAALGFGTRVYMTTENIEHAGNASIDLNGGVDGAFSARDIRELPVGQAVVRMKLRGAGQPPFTVKIAPPDIPLDPAPFGDTDAPVSGPQA